MVRNRPTAVVAIAGLATLAGSATANAAPAASARAAITVASPQRSVATPAATGFEQWCVVTAASCKSGNWHTDGSRTMWVEAVTQIGGGNFKLIDASNGVTVWSKGLGNFQDKLYSVPGLYSSYYCTVANAGPGAECLIASPYPY
jgi:hypothetical protein